MLPKWRQDRWNEGFAALSKFRAREGHCRPSRHHVEGDFKLGPWVTTQRYNKDNLSAERKRRLNAIGFVWNWRDYLWDRGFMALLKFKRREGHCHVSILHREGNYKLGYWVSTQRRKRKDFSRTGSISIKLFDLPGRYNLPRRYSIAPAQIANTIRMPSRDLMRKSERKRALVRSFRSSQDEVQSVPTLPGL